jgi:hypothetical protein
MTFGDLRAILHSNLHDKAKWEETIKFFDAHHDFDEIEQVFVPYAQSLLKGTRQAPENWIYASKDELCVTTPAVLLCNKLIVNLKASQGHHALHGWKKNAHLIQHITDLHLKDIGLPISTRLDEVVEHFKDLKTLRLEDYSYHQQRSSSGDYVTGNLDWMKHTEEIVFVRTRAYCDDLMLEDISLSPRSAYIKKLDLRGSNFSTHGLWALKQSPFLSRKAKLIHNKPQPAPRYGHERTVAKFKERLEKVKANQRQDSARSLQQALKPKDT